jgi:uncharacterized membrane protein
MTPALPHRYRRHGGLFAALLLASALSTLLIAGRIVHTGRLTYAFLVFNLGLAWIPVFLAVAADSLGARRSRASTALAVLCGTGWLVFFPNAPYLLTDLMHLRVQGNRLFWLDIIALPSFAWTGLALGFVSLYYMQRLAADRLGRVLSWVFAAATIAASAFGIYLGRFRRWNSWDVVRNPEDLLRDVARTLLHPFENAEVMAFCAVLATFLFAAYLVLYAWTHVHEEPSPAREGVPPLRPPRSA